MNLVRSSNLDSSNKHYGLGTAISMIVGICIGSGIFFKADDILNFAGGNIGLSLVVFVLGALCVIFGNITLSQLAAQTDRQGGIVAYFDVFLSRKFATAFGWFQLFAYYPSISVVICWVAGIYTTMLFDLPSTLEIQIIIGIVYLIYFHFLNYYSVRLGGLFQNFATLLKLIPLIGIGFIGLFWQTPIPEATQNLIVPVQEMGWSWLAALAPVAFSFDGWAVSTSISHEVRDAKRTMPLALTIGPLIVLVVYIAYFMGMVAIVGPEYILTNGDSTIYSIGTMLFGDFGGKVMLTLILIAVLGVLNGLVLGNLRLPQSLAVNKMLPNHRKIQDIDERTQLSPRAAVISFIISIAWLALHYLTQKTNILSGGDVSEIAIVFSYVTYCLLYVKVIQLSRQGKIQSKWLGIVIPTLGILGASVIVLGGIMSNPTYVPLFLLACSLIFIGGYRFAKK